MPGWFYGVMKSIRNVSGWVYGVMKSISNAWLTFMVSQYQCEIRGWLSGDTKSIHAMRGWLYGVTKSINDAWLIFWCHEMNNWCALRFFTLINQLMY